MEKIKVKTFSSYKLYDVKDYYQQVYSYLLKKKMEFCYLESGEFISREDCEKYLN